MERIKESIAQLFSGAEYSADVKSAKFGRTIIFIFAGCETAIEIHQFNGLESSGRFRRELSVNEAQWYAYVIQLYDFNVSE